MAEDRRSEETIGGVEDASTSKHLDVPSSSKNVAPSEISHDDIASTYSSNAHLHVQVHHPDSKRSDGKVELTEDDAPEVLGFAYTTFKKWSILSVIFVVQCSMNFNASIYANGVPLLTEKFGVSEQAARVGQMIFLISYAFGCELWAPWSEELGRFPTLQLSLLFVNSE
jgi:hypothetical protein